MNKLIFISLLAGIGGCTANAQDADVKQVYEVANYECAYPRFFSDGSKILYQSNKTGNWQLYVVDRDGKNNKRITTDKYNNNFVDISPDNKKVAFVSDRDGNEEIYVMNMDGTGLKRLTFDRERDIHPYFSPDGLSLLFNSTRDIENRSFDVYKINIDGSGLERITNTIDQETCARYSADKKRILYLCYNDSLAQDDIYVMEADGSNRKNLTNTVEQDGWPTWSPDGQHIIYSAMSGGRYRLFEMNNDGSNTHPIIDRELNMDEARAGVNKKDKDIVFNYKKANTIGIYILKRS